MIQFDQEKIYSKYGGVRKQIDKANQIGHINNIYHFKNRKESDLDKVIITNYDYEGKQVHYGKYERIDDLDTVFVLEHRNSNL